MTRYSPGRRAARSCRSASGSSGWGWTNQSNQSLSKLKIGEYLGQHAGVFCAKVLSLFLQEFDFAGLRLDKAIRRLLGRSEVSWKGDG